MILEEEARKRIEALMTTKSPRQLAVQWHGEVRYRTLVAALVAVTLAALSIPLGTHAGAWYVSSGFEGRSGPAALDLLLDIALGASLLIVSMIMLLRSRDRQTDVDRAIKLQRERQYRILHSGEAPTTIQ